MRTMAQWLKRPSMQDFARSQYRLTRLNQSFNSILESRFHGHCQVMAHDQHTLWCQASDAAMATQLRFQAPILLPLLRKRMALPQLQQLVVRVQASHAPPSPPARQAKRPSINAAHCLREVANHCQHPALKKSLLSLAKRHR